MSRTNFDQLLQAGCHFGHLRRKWNPAMAPYIERPNYINAVGAGKSLDYINEFRDSLQDLH